jgi:hypothetical protein
MSFNQIVRITVTSQQVNFEYSHDFKHGTICVKPKAELLQLLNSLEGFLPIVTDDGLKFKTNIQKIFRNENEYVIVICTEVPCRNFIFDNKTEVDMIQEKLISALKQILNLLEVNQ